MEGRGNSPTTSVTSALEAIGNLAIRELNELFLGGQVSAMNAHDQIKLAPISRKADIFYRHLLPWRKNLVLVLANSYRRCFTGALAHRSEAEDNPEQWARVQLQPVVIATLEWIREWYILACDGANQSVEPVGTIEYSPRQTT